MRIRLTRWRCHEYSARILFGESSRNSWGDSFRKPFKNFSSNSFENFTWYSSENSKSLLQKSVYEFCSQSYRYFLTAFFSNSRCVEGSTSSLFRAIFRNFPGILLRTHARNRRVSQLFTYYWDLLNKFFQELFKIFFQIYFQISVNKFILKMRQEFVRKLEVPPRPSPWFFF